MQLLIGLVAKAQRHGIPWYHMAILVSGKPKYGYIDNPKKQQ